MRSKDDEGGMLTAYLNGFGVSISLILAIGAQNAFLLKQGLRREHVMPLVLLCAFSDAALMTIGVFGFTALKDTLPALAPVMLWLGVVFLFFYGGFSFWRAWKGGAALDPARGAGMSLRAAVLFCLAVTYLNPHVYLDTVLLVGSIATQFDGFEGAYWAGAVSASFVFFFSLGYGARLLAPVMARPASWRILEVLIGCVMWAIALGLIFKG